MQEESPFVSHDELACALERPTASALLKQSSADFLVDEELGFACTGSGEHLFLRVRKRNHSTLDVARMLARTLQLREVDVGYAGMKDRRAETTQWFSVLTGDEARARLASLQSDSLEILETVRNERKLKIGSHRKNHFQLLLREVRGDREGLESRLQQLQQGGVPNYFGAQRFGRNQSNLHQALAMLQEGAGPGSRRRRRRGMLFSAARAYLFNLLLSERIRQGNWRQYVPGDVLNLDGTQRCFAVEPDQWDENLQQRLDSMDIHPTGPLAGITENTDSYLPRAIAADIEEAVLAQNTRITTGLCEQGLQAARRPLRFRVEALEWEWQDTDQLSLRFSLSRGSYATSLLRELCMTSEPGENVNQE